MCPQFYHGFIFKTKNVSVLASTVWSSRRVLSLILGFFLNTFPAACKLISFLLQVPPFFGTKFPSTKSCPYIRLHSHNQLLPLKLQTQGKISFFFSQATIQLTFKFLSLHLRDCIFQPAISISIIHKNHFQVQLLPHITTFIALGPHRDFCIIQDILI